jgi:hypothetical protein
MVRRQLLDGGEMRSIVTGVNPSAGPAPILLLAADDQLSEIAALVQTGDAVFFRIRTRAAVVGLRNPAIRLSNVFPPGSGQDTVTLTASFAAGRYRIESDRAGDHRERTLAVSPSWIWALLMPIPHYSFGAEVRIVTAAWLFAVLGLAAFWGARSAPSGVTATSRRRMGAAVRILVAILAGLAVVPVGFGLSVSHWSEWLAAVVGVACGWMLGLRRSPPRGGPVPTGAATS